ncbi:MAG TPA: hypothetical protein VFE12_16900, partial [Acetobacteraceae bacterium]|nr:hypothetical protein [Acetobacteraceae bacterium]
MQKKLTITVDADVYEGLHSVIGRRKISRFLTDLARPHVARGIRRDGSRRSPRARGQRLDGRAVRGCSRRTAQTWLNAR